MYYPKPVKTSDGSITLYEEKLDEHYHSTHGAFTESSVVFIKNGLNYLQTSPVKILEVGFGTGLNALLTLRESQKRSVEIHYIAVEPFPLQLDIINQLNYGEYSGNKENFEFYKEWFNKDRCHFREGFKLEKIFSPIQKIRNIQDINCIYFDAFAPDVQPEMWDRSVFLLLHDLLTVGGILVTYCAKGSFKRTLRDCGFNIETLPGPPGKREMVRGIKKN